MILKIIGSVLTISSMSAMGFYFSTILKTRLAELKELKKYIFILRGDIRYGGTPLPEAMDGLAGRSPGSFQHFFRIIADKLCDLNGETFGEVWKQGVEQDLKDTCLNKEDKMYLEKFGEHLGYLDKEMQINTIDLFITQLEAQIADLTGMVKEKTRLYNLLGIMAGVFVTIIMI